MNRKIIAISMFLTLMATATLAQNATLNDAMQNGQTSLNLRFSFEYAALDDAAGNDAATGLNIRTRLAYKTGEWADNSLYLQFQNVSAIIADYAPIDSDFDVIADPEGTSVYQGYIDNMSVSDTRIRIGRQEIILDDHRLMGNIGWRQQGQTFSAIGISNNSVSGLNIILDYAWRVKTIFNTQADLDSLIILEGIYTAIADQRISVAYLALDSPGGIDSDRDLATIAARIEGKAELIEYAADFATQSGYADNSNGGGTMTNAFVAIPVGIKLGLGYSVISGASDNTRAFDTLFSTAHKFNGWSDQFLATNGGNLSLGLNDTYLQAGGKAGEIGWLARYHIFQAETESTNYGTEIDLLASKPITKNLKGLVKAALYTADSGNTTGVATADESVIWVRAEYAF